MTPPTMWTPTTSSESSYPRRSFRLTAQKHTNAGGKADRERGQRLHVSRGRGDRRQPGHRPVAAPIVVTLPVAAAPRPSTPSTAAAAPSCVFTNALDASPLAASALPALNPNHPNHRSPAPRITNGTLCGACRRMPKPRRLPRRSRHQRRHARVDVHDRAAGEVEGARPRRRGSRRPRPSGRRA